LNQAISGETSAQLLRRLDLFDATAPETIFVMIGINDLRQGYGDDTLLANHRTIVRYLKAAHPNAQIFVQAILPHAGDRLKQLYPGTVAPEWTDQLIAVPNRRIRSLNQQLAEIARSEKVSFLDLYPHFADAEGNLIADLSTDGLHLSRRGYEVWRRQIDRAAGSGE
jgi:lysophospholipase L1-like esterase